MMCFIAGRSRCRGNARRQGRSCE